MVYHQSIKLLICENRINKIKLLTIFYNFYFNFRER